MDTAQAVQRLIDEGFNPKMIAIWANDVSVQSVTNWAAKKYRMSVDSYLALRRNCPRFAELMDSKAA